MPRSPGLLFALAVACVPGAFAQSHEEMMTAARADCVRAARDYPATHRPAEASAAAPNCDASVFYYGIGRPVDDLKARACAFASNDAGVLMMLYANGRGVARDFAVARHAACAMEAAPAEMSGRLAHLGEMEHALAQGRVPAAIDVCDDITSGYMMGVCAGLAARQAVAKRQAETARLTRGWPPAQQAAWTRLQGRAEAYAGKRGDGEVDMSGTARAAMAIGAEEDARDAHLQILRDLEGGRVDATLADRAALQERELNEIYGQLRALPEPETTTVTMESIRATQRAWLGYRDAWLAFARLRYPAVPAAALRARLTAERVKNLQQLLEERRP